MRFKMNSLEPGAYFRNFRVLDELLSEWDKLKVKGTHTNPGHGQYLKHAHSHITRAVAAFALIALGFFKQNFCHAWHTTIRKGLPCSFPSRPNFLRCPRSNDIFLQLVSHSHSSLYLYIDPGKLNWPDSLLNKGACFSTVSWNNLLQALRGRREIERYAKRRAGEGGGEKRKFPPVLFSCSRFLYPRGPEYLRAWNRLIKNPSSSTLIHWIVRNFKIPGAYRGHLTTILSRHCWGGDFDWFFFCTIVVVLHANG